jgi:AAA+ superfamily predicted ATPase
VHQDSDKSHKGSRSDSAAGDKTEKLAAGFETPPALEALCQAFALSPFERDLLLLCAGVELDSRLAKLVAVAQDKTHRAFPTFNLALAVLPEAHWSALTPAAALRRWRLVEMGSGEGFSQSPLQIDERILHYLMGVSYLDTRLQGMIEPIPTLVELPESHRKVAEQIADCWSRANTASPRPVIQLCGDQETAKGEIAAYAFAELGLGLRRIHAGDIPGQSAERDALARLWEREAALDHSVLMIDNNGSKNHRPAVSFIENTHSLLIVATQEPLRLGNRPALRLDVAGLSSGEQLTQWCEVLGPSAEMLNGQLEHLVAQFNLDRESIESAGARILEQGGREDMAAMETLLWDACRTQARQRLDELAQHIDPVATWDDLVLPQAQAQTLCDIAAHVRHRLKVYESWGFAEKCSRGLGISALFAGPSGTGKTMAAEVLANELRLDLYRIDLSQVVNKYIGETEKNLKRVFDAAESSGAILLFDEADALFGKRSDVKDSHDRYANIEVSYLLQRMEAYRGLAILTTNMKQALDQAFLRRIRFVVQFPFPDAELRAEIWQKVFPEKTPTNGLDITKLARLDVGGGNIRNIAMQGAFFAAEESEPVGMGHLLQAARREYGKLEKPLTDKECRGWV